MKTIVTLEFASSEEAIAFLSGSKKSAGPKKKPVEDSLGDDLGDDDGMGLEDDDLDLGEEKSLKVQIQEKAAALSNEGKADKVKALVKKAKVTKLSAVPEKMETKFLEALNKL